MAKPGPKTLLEWLVAIPSLRTVIVTVIVVVVLSAILFSSIRIGPPPPQSP